MASVRLGLGFCLVLGIVCGCASDRNTIDRRLAGLSDDISRLQATNDRLMQRVDALELERTQRRERPADAAPAPTVVEHAPLRVVKVEPPRGTQTQDNIGREVAPEERPDAPGERPVIRVRGKADTKADERPPTASVRLVEEEGVK
jgi:hypothetical protein